MYEVFACNYSDIYPTEIGYKGPRAGIYNLVIVIVNYVVHQSPMENSGDGWAREGPFAKRPFYQLS